MRKFLKRFPFNKLFVSLFVTLYTFLPSAQLIEAGASLPVVNVTKTTQYSTIQEAVNAADSGDTIEVSSGVYDENLVINTNSLIIKGVGTTKPIIHPTGTPPSTKRLVDLRGSNVTFENFEIIGNNNLTTTGDFWVGIAVSGQNNTIEGNDIKELLTGIQTNTQNVHGNNQILDNSVSHTFVGISLQNDTNTITENSLSDIAEEGFGLLNTTNSTFENNYLDVNTTGVNARDYSADPLSYINFSDFIANNTFTHLVTRTNSLGEILGDKLYVNIQDAIDNAGTGETVKVYPGTYQENVEINTPELTLQSTEGFEKTLITNPSIGEETPGISILKDLGEITVDGFTANGFRNGIIQGMSNSTGTYPNILNNKIIPENNDTPDAYLRNGIQITGLAGRVAGNYVVGAPLTSDWASSGIGVVNAKNILVEDNIVNTGNADIGISVLNYSAELVENITLINNSVISAGNGIRIDGRTSDKYVKGISILGNHLKGCGSAINFRNGSVEDIQILNNIIKDNSEYGIHFSSLVTVTGPAEIERNSITNNAEYGLINSSSYSMFAQNNWWGDLSGPYNATSNPTGTGDAVSDNVEFCPWLDSEDGDPENHGSISRSADVDREAAFSSEQG